MAPTKPNVDTPKIYYSPLANMDEQGKQVCLGLLKLFKIDGVSADQVATDGQIEIFHAVISRRWDRVHIESSTQYGKSLFIALGCIILSCIEGEVVSIVAPTTDKAQIIMRYYIAHIGDNAIFSSKLDKDTILQKLQMETSKDRILLKNKGGIFALSVQAGNAQKGFQAAMGEGSKIVISDESALIPDQIEATIFRMGAGKKDFVYIKIGNPFYRNHFYKSSIDPIYHKIKIDYKQGLREGRYTQAFIEEAMKKPHFSILFGCEFPPEDITDSEGWTNLFSSQLIEKAQNPNIVMYGEKRLGVDVAEGGGDKNAEVLRGANRARIIKEFVSPDTMQTVGIVIVDMKELEVFDHNVFWDALGVGKGGYDRLTEQMYRPFPVKFSEMANDDTQFANQRAECYWLAYQWLSAGGTLEPDTRWEELTWIRYKVDSRGRIQIEPKDANRKRGYPSPNVADAFVSTFARKNVINISKEQKREEKEILKQFDAYRGKKVNPRILRQG